MRGHDGSIWFAAFWSWQLPGMPLKRMLPTGRPPGNPRHSSTLKQSRRGFRISQLLQSSMRGFRHKNCLIEPTDRPEILLPLQVKVWHGLAGSGREVVMDGGGEVPSQRPCQPSGTIRRQKPWLSVSSLPTLSIGHYPRVYLSPFLRSLTSVMDNKGDC
jgi:hypothetical protein